MNTTPQSTAVARPDELDVQLLDGLRCAELLLASFGVKVPQADIAALVALRVLEWANPQETVGVVAARLNSLHGVPAPAHTGVN